MSKHTSAPPRLPDMFYVNPPFAKCRWSAKQVRAWLLDSSDGCYFANGKSWRLKATHVAAGAYQVAAEEANR